MTIIQFSPGVNTDFSTELNANFADSKIRVIYTDTGFDTQQTGAGTNSDDHELTAINTANVGGASHLTIKILYQSNTFESGSGSALGASNTLQIQTKDVGGSYSDSMAKLTVSSIAHDNDNLTVNRLLTLTWVHVLTADEKSNGVQVKILATSVAGETSNSASLVNIQTVLSV